MAEILKYRLAFHGGEAERNRLPAHEGSISLEGMTWTISLISHYAATGEIKSRGALSEQARVYLSPSRQGSYLQDLWIELTTPESLFVTTVAGAYVVGTAGQVVNSLIVSSVQGVCGLAGKLLNKEEKILKKLPSGDREALIDRIEPSMKRAHTVIDEGATKLEIRRGYTPLVTLDGRTKAYVNADFLTDETMLVASVGAYNANTGNGSVYLPNVGKMVPFFAPKGLDPKTYAALSYSLDRYVNEKPSNIEIACKKTLSLDDRIKRLTIVRAFKEISNDRQ
jgi:hypothetical protein